MADADERARWSRVGTLFHQALDTPVEQRAEMLDAACGDDEALRHDVESLLAAHERPDSRLDRFPATAADLLASDAAEALVGRHVGPYDVLDLVGRGGMGVVYRARDTRLGRDVALKALSSAVVDDGSRRERLRREARAAAALSHTGIATVYALEEIDGHLYMASEFVPGRTLRQELADGPLPVARAQDTLQQVGRALAAAHANGIVHRDLKPENVIRRPDGSIKVLDFGLARIQPASGDARLTDDGAVLGTPAYMSPEQLRGEPVDARADVFAMGVLGYELLAGRTPFDSDHGATVVARVLEANPAPLRPPPGSSADQRAAWDRVGRVIGRCLQKAPDERFPSAADVVTALESGVVPPAASTKGAGPRDAIWWWQFHQSSASVGHVVMLLPLWLAGEQAPSFGLTAFLAGLSGALGGSLLRLHLLFAFRSYPAEAAAQRAATRPWIAAADGLLAAACLAAGALVLRLNAELASALVAGAVALTVASRLVEPATTRAAFGADQSSPGRAP